MSNEFSVKYSNLTNLARPPQNQIICLYIIKILEHIVYEVTLDKTKWLIYAIYRPPSMANDIFTNHMNILLDKGSKFIENYMVIGDLNYDILTPDKSQVLMIYVIFLI